MTTDGVPNGAVPNGGVGNDGAPNSGVTTSEAVANGPRWCDRCGEAVASGDHSLCVAARALEPPRFCPDCRRRMKVQVLPTGWAATCVQHVVRRS